MRAHAFIRRSFINPLTLSILGFLCLLIFGMWAISVALPVVTVELRYQYKSILRDVFHVDNIKAVIFPQFRLDLTGATSKHKTNGITIPAIFIDEPVIYNVDPNDPSAYLAALKKGIAHASGTNFPGTGGLGYYFAHSSSPQFVNQYNAVFYLLGKLKPGDPVYVWHDGVRADYTVTYSEVTSPGDLTFLTTKPETETIVLQTCWPPGTTKSRLLVYAKFVPK